MSVALTDGPLALEARHIFVPGNGAPQVIFNDAQGVLPRIKLDDMPGFRSLPEAEDNRWPRTARIGSQPMPSMVRDKTFTIEGKIQAASLPQLRAFQQTIGRALWERDLEGTWSVLPVPPWGDDSDYWQGTARVLQFEPTIKWQNALRHPLGPWQVPILAGFRMSDPRFVWTEARAVNGGGALTATNQGNAPAEPTITVSGASGTVIVLNTTINKSLNFSSLPGGNLVLDFAARTAMIGDDDMQPYLDSYNSTWWDRGVPGLQPGDNVITRAGGSEMLIAWKDTSW